MEKILTIDFDIIMAPSIELYNDLVGDNKGVNDIIQKYPLLEYTLSGDFFIYELLTGQLIKLFKNIPPENIHFIREHHQLIKFVNNKEKINLINIDHHHDLGYEKLSKKILLPNCGNWVKYLYEKDLLESYIWIHNSDSVMPNSKIIINNDYNLKDYNFQDLDKIDKLIICNSPQWLPTNFQALFTSWIGIAENYFERNFDIL